LIERASIESQTYERYARDKGNSTRQEPITHVFEPTNEVKHHRKVKQTIYGLINPSVH